MLGSVNHFDEIALIKGMKRMLSVRVSSQDAKLLLLLQQHVQPDLGQHQELLEGGLEVDGA